MLEHGKKKRVFACAFDWPGWDRSARKGADVLAVLAEYRPRYARVAARAGLSSQFGKAGGFDVVEEVEGIGMTDYYGVSGKPASAETRPMTPAQLKNKIGLLQACWLTFDETAMAVSEELRPGPRGGGWGKERIIRHVNGAEIQEFAPKVGVKVPLETRDDPAALRDYRDAVIEGIRDHHQRGAPARSWSLQFLIRRCA
jgi:hypothetical protein